MKKVSVIIPVYNTTEFLPECLESVINQTYTDLEILLINDGSDQGCRDLLEEYANKDARIYLVDSIQRKGVGAARNAGINRASGDFVYFLDSDDYLPLSTIERHVHHIGSHSMLTGRVKKVTVKPEEAGEERNSKVLKNRNKTRLFKNYSVLNRLISMEFVKGNKLRFSENVENYSDVEFLIPCMINMKKYPYITECLYYKRVRNDPITNPALSQMDKDKVVRDYMAVYNLLKDQYEGNGAVSKFLDRQFLNYYRKSVIMLLADQKQVPQSFNSISIAAKKVNPKALKKLNVVVKTEINQLRNEKQASYARLIKLHHLLRNAKRAVKSRRKVYVFLYRNFFIRMPMKQKKIVFESFLGKNYSDSPKNIYEEMHQNYKDYKFIWSFNEKRKIPGNAKQVKRFSLAYYYHLATSKYWVSNSRLPMHLDKRPGNIYLQTWHGTPLKKLVFDMNEIHSANPKYKLHFYKQSRRWDYLIAANQYSSDIFKSAFKFEKKMLEFGYPRNDILHDAERDHKADELKLKFGLPLDKKVILYAPTWRDDDFYEPGKYKFQLRLNLQQMKERLGDEYVILLRMHYFIADDIDTSGAEGFAYNFSKHNDIADLYLISDILITDYSSVFFDYANLKRPILFYTYDLEKYRDTLRGFYINMEEEVPGPLLRDSEDVIRTIENIDEVMEQYKGNYERFYEKFCGWEKGNATKQVVKQVFKS
ncbi:bifunctional glycosyltransferase/CDP-glycerol:glycerophosphate glycerophosphotransferase [Fictibacillus fluitans]|uniref:CDP-glycerol:glycerophosphate glycerophosphotransferase n=1 Tax=Fictibacillus fluitans TaxID=3058422 RepID=A0ABT8HZD7_9BACL|nr:CDP-glycerol:glycerophosphate glycerophosphotransferase [Fictibacillus sp. NE201]MDN4526069.1 CDP-glycerol:glycerophosphate glycerophosphotransferase [Fictibacillus sp. NE201]